MSEKVVVSNNVPHYMPKFRNSIYNMAEKQEIRKEIINEIINVEFTNGIAPLIKELNGLNSMEIDEIINMWNLIDVYHDDYDYKRLTCLYEEPLRNGDLNQIEIADLYYYQNIEKFKKSLRRG